MWCVQSSLSSFVVLLAVSGAAAAIYVFMEGKEHNDVENAGSMEENCSNLYCIFRSRSQPKLELAIRFHTRLLLEVGEDNTASGLGKSEFGHFTHSRRIDREKWGSQELQTILLFVNLG